MKITKLTSQAGMYFFVRFRDATTGLTYGEVIKTKDIDSLVALLETKNTLDLIDIKQLWESATIAQDLQKEVLSDAVSVKGEKI